MDDNTRRADQERREAGLPPWDARTELYAGGISSSRFADLPVATRLGTLARAWLAELYRIGISAGRKTEHETDYPLDYRNGPHIRPARLDNGETVWLQLGAYLDEHGFARTQVLDTPLRTDRAILAALAVLEGGDGDPVKVREALTPQKDDEGEPVYGRLGGSEERLLLVADNLLLQYRPDFRDLTEEEQRELRVKACNKVAATAVAARELHDVLEYGKPHGRTRKSVKDADGDLYAAQLHHFAGMKLKEIASELSLGTNKFDPIKAENRNAGNRIKRGVNLFVRALGADGWEDYKRRMRAEYERRSNTHP